MLEISAQMELVLVDTSGIQPYIFGSNRLQENIGASHLVAQATHEWVWRTVREVAPECNVQLDGVVDESARIEDGKIRAEVIYTGGGNALVVFRGGGLAARFERSLSERALVEAPDLRLHVAMKIFDWNADRLNEIQAQLAEDLARDKRRAELSSPLLGLGVSRLCHSTGLPAVGDVKLAGGDEPYPAHASIHAKLAVAGSSHPPETERERTEAERRLSRLIPPPSPDYKYPRQFDHLGRTHEEHSYIAVIHADGDEIGARIEKLGENDTPNRSYIQDLRAFSQALDSAARQALLDTVCAVCRRIEEDDRGRAIRHSMLRIELRKEKGAYWLPLRPIVFGGDDMTMVCDGRLGMAMAVEYLQHFRQRTSDLPDGRGAASACAGIAIVKAHYPFARAYGLAEELSREAKAYRRELYERCGYSGPCLDWHFATGGLGGSLNAIRSREYQVKLNGQPAHLNLRPVTRDNNCFHTARAWATVRDGIDAFQDPEQWAGRRNKVKALRDALRGGSKAVNQFLGRYGLKTLPPVGAREAGWDENGWVGERCVYFDAIEMADWFMPLE
ncbi:MAG: Cas10/Cmr2 second palm domain-containing protein [bacterium]